MKYQGTHEPFCKESFHVADWFQELLYTHAEQIHSTVWSQSKQVLVALHMALDFLCCSSFNLKSQSLLNNSFAKGAAVTGPKKDEAHPASALPEASCPSRKQLSALTNCLTFYYSSRENCTILKKSEQ